MNHKLMAVTAAATLTALSALAAPPAGAASRTHDAASAPAPRVVNLIRDAGAERAKPDTSGDKVPVAAWTVSKTNDFTAVAYGASGFPTSTSPGPKYRGHNFFAGGQSGNSSTGTQIDSLASDRSLIRSGKAHFTLGAWLGGYSSQGDHATLTVTWETAAGKSITTTKVGPVSARQRKDLTGMLHRSTAGTVPRTATKVLVTLHMVRDAGEYVDGYADDLSLTIKRG